MSLPGDSTVLHVFNTYSIFQENRVPALMARPCLRYDVRSCPAHVLELSLSQTLVGSLSWSCTCNLICSFFLFQAFPRIVYPNCTKSGRKKSRRCHQTQLYTHDGRRSGDRRYRLLWERYNQVVEKRHVFMSFIFKFVLVFFSSKLEVWCLICCQNPEHRQAGGGRREADSAHFRRSSLHAEPCCVHDWTLPAEVR